MPPRKPAAKESKPPREQKRKRGKNGEADKSVSGDAEAVDGRGMLDGSEVVIDASRQRHADPAAGAQVVVIHPGSASLRVGLASEHVPLVIPHCIAWRLSGTDADASEHDGNSDAVADAETTTRLESEMSAAMRPIGRALRVGQALLGTEPHVSPSVCMLGNDVAGGHVSTTSASAATARIGGSSAFATTLVGDAAVRAARSEPGRWRLFYPMRRGRFSTEAPLSIIISALESIWRAALCGGNGIRGLDLSPSDLRAACVVIVLPDLFARREGAELLGLLLSEQMMGFAAAIVLEEATSACLGAGVPSACVVDLGSQRSSVSCVDELMPMPGCRQVLAYGGDDLDRLLLWLFERHSLTARLPWTLPAAADGRPPSVRRVVQHLSPLRHAACHLELHRVPHSATAPGAAATPLAPPAACACASNGAAGTATIADNDAPPVAVDLGSLASVPPLLLFAPNAARVLHTRALASPPLALESRQLDWSDVWDDDFLQESAAPLRGAALGRGEREAAEGEADEVQGGVGGKEAREPFQPQQSAREIAREHKARLNASCSLAGTPASSLPSLTVLGSRHQSQLLPDELLEYTPLDEAIVRAVERGKSTEVKRRLYGTILLLGGVSRTRGLSAYLEWRIATCWRLAPDSTEGIERVEVQRLPPGAEAETLVWRGGAALASLPSAKSMWILRLDWAQRGAMAARERCIFTW